MGRKELPKLYETERLLKKSKFFGKEVPLPNDESYYTDLHDRIMAQIDNTDIKPVPYFHKEKDLLKRHWRFYTMFSLLIPMMMISFAFVKTYSFELFQNNHAVKRAQNEDNIVSIIRHSPDLMAKTVLSYKSEDELFTDAAIFSNEDLTKAVADSL